MRMRELGRLYLPREALDKAGIASSDPALVLASPALDAAAQPVIEEAQRRFRLAKDVMDRCPRAAVRAPRLMAAAYGRILERLRRAAVSRRRARPCESSAGASVAGARPLWSCF